MGRCRRLLGALPTYAALAWWGLVAPRWHREVLTRHQAAILGPEGVVLALRDDLQGWELPGGAAQPGESGEDAVRREVREEVGLEVEIEAHVGDYTRSGFRPHVARIYRCRARGGALRAGAETLAAAWFDPLALPRTLFPWHRGPLADALAKLPEPVVLHEHHGWRHILAGLVIDLAMRWRGPPARAVQQWPA